MTLKGYTVPRTPEGRSSLVPYPPWHYVGAFLVVDYWADPEKAVAFLPEGIDPHPDPGRCAFVAADWQSCSEGGDELVDPSRSQYKEVFVVCSGLLDGEEVTVCSYIWVDRDFALTRGWIQGFPKKLGSIWITRSFGLGGPADPGWSRAPASARRAPPTSGASRRRRSRSSTRRRAARSTTRRRSSTSATSRGSPQGSTTRPAVHELVRAVSRDRSASEVWEGSATLELFGARARGGRRARPGADRPRLPLHVRLHRRRPRDCAASSAREGRARHGRRNGIGAAIARRLAADGYAVAVTGRRAAPIEEVAAEVDGLAVVADTGVADDAERAVARDGRALRRARRARLQRRHRRRGIAARPRPGDVGRRAPHEPHGRLPDGTRGDRPPRSSAAARSSRSRRLQGSARAPSRSRTARPRRGCRC